MTRKSLLKIREKNYRIWRGTENHDKWPIFVTHRDVRYSVDGE